MEYLLDTDTISYYCKGNPEVIAKMGIVADTDLFISVVSTIEIDFGYATNLEAKNSHHYRYAALLERVNLIEFSGSDALLTTQIRTELYPDKMGCYDAFLAGTALARDFIFVTNNTKHFSRIRGLKLENWKIV